MKELVSILTLAFFSLCSLAFAEEENIVFDLYPQTRPYIYSVGFKYEGVDRWYQIEISEFRDGKTTQFFSDVYYDSISENFFTIHSGVISIIPINRPYELRFHKKNKLVIRQFISASCRLALHLHFCLLQ